MKHVNGLTAIVTLSALTLLTLLFLPTTAAPHETREAALAPALASLLPVTSPAAALFVAPIPVDVTDPAEPKQCKKIKEQACTGCPGELEWECKAGRDYIGCILTVNDCAGSGAGNCDNHGSEGPCGG